MSARSSAVGELRHTFRTPVNHIVGYTEMLLEDLPPGDDEHREPLKEILAAAHDALSHISAVLVPSEVPANEAVRRLYDELEEPQARIIRAVSSLITAHDLGDAAADDLRRILNAAEQLRPKDLELTAPAAAAEEEPEAERPSRILVVDDVEDNRQLLRRRLEKQGYAVTCAEDGKKALAVVEREEPDLILLDIMMPELDGFAVLERLKANKHTRDIPVIVISALDDTASAVRCIEQGAEDFLPKPFDPVLLKARVGSSLAKKRARDRERAVALAAEAVATAAAAVETGTYRAGSLAEIAKRRDAVGRLARVFDAMATNIRAREQQLHERVRALKNDIAKARESATKTTGSMAAAMMQTGERIAGRYEILATLGRGGMGAVYRVRDGELGEEIALKTLRKESVADEAVIERFKSEIRLARKITHRNVVRTHDLGEFEGGYFLTMELVEGITVRELIDTRGKLGVESVLAIGTQLADALAAAHARGRDPSRREAAQPAAGCGGRAQGDGLRRGAAHRPRGRGAHRDRTRGGHARLHAAGAAARRRSGRARGSVCGRRGVVRGGDGAAALRSRDGHGTHRSAAQRRGSAGARRQPRSTRGIGRPDRRVAIEAPRGAAGVRGGAQGPTRANGVV